MKIFNPKQGQRVWRPSQNRDYDIWVVQEVGEVILPDHLFNSRPSARVELRRPGRGIGPYTDIGPDRLPYAGQP